MKRAALLLFAVLAITAAPALSVRPYAPAPVDFEMAAPSSVASAASSGRLVSPVLRAPMRFNLAGLRWRGRRHVAVALRARRDGGRWSPWTPVGAHGEGGSDPAWFGDADSIQYRLSRRVPSVRVYFVNALGTSTPAARARTAVRRVAQRAVVTAARIVSPATAQTTQPTIQPRAAWGADACAPRGAPDFGEVRAAYVHHTVSANDYTAEEAPAIVLSICRYHRNSQGWNDIGYNFVVDKFGTIWEGRAGGIDQAVIGAQAQGYNAQSTGVSVIGTHSSLPAGEPALDAIARLIRWKLPLHGQPTTGTTTVVSAGGSANRYPRGREVELERVSGHRDTGTTECPGNALYAQLPDIRGRVGDVRPQRARTRVAASSAARTVRYGTSATLSGVLTQITGDPVGGVEVQLQSFTDVGWQTVERGTTAADGSFRLSAEMRAKRVLRVMWAGDDARLPSTSKSTTVYVLPTISIAREAARVKVGGLAKLIGEIQPAKRKLVLAVEHLSGRKRSRSSRSIIARGGDYVARWRVRQPGLYRFQIVFAGDASNSTNRSSSIYVRAVRAAPPAPPAGPDGGTGGGGASPGGGASAG